MEKEDHLFEELCKKGKAYRAKRMAAGEKSSAYLSGRAVKVCKGQMQGENLNEEPKDGVDGVKPGSIKPDVIRGRKVKRYIKISKKGRETPMISYDEPDPSDKPKDEPKDKPKDEPKNNNVKKYPFIGGESGNQYEVQKFNMDPEAEKLYKSLQNTMIDRKDSDAFLKSLRLTAIANDEIFLLRTKAETDKKASKAMVKCCEDLLKYIHSESGMKDAVRMHNYLDKHITLIKEFYKKNPREDKEDDCFTISDLETRSKNKLRFKLGGKTFGARNPAPTYESKIHLANIIKESIKIKDNTEFKIKLKHLLQKHAVNLKKGSSDTEFKLTLKHLIKKHIVKGGEIEENVYYVDAINENEAYCPVCTEVMLETVKETLNKIDEKKGKCKPSKGKRFAKRVSGKCRSFGQKGKAKKGGDRIRPGTKKGNAYCARSAKIKKCKNPPCANALSRKKWKCQGSRSVK